MDSENFDYSRIFYGVSAFFAVLSVLYFGFEHIQNLSPFTIAAVLFTAFASALIVGVSRETRGVKLTSYLVSAGSYLGFLIYINGRFLTSSDGTLASLLISAGLFSAIGYVMTNRQDYIPDRSQARKILAGIGLLLTLLFVYDAVAVNVEFTVELEDEIELVEGENVYGELGISKSGYLPADIDRQRFSVCTHRDGSTRGLGGSSVGGYMSGFAPETDVEDLEFRLPPQFYEEMEDLNEGDVLEIEKVGSCREVELEEGVLGVEFPSGASHQQSFILQVPGED